MSVVSLPIPTSADDRFLVERINNSVLEARRRTGENPVLTVSHTLFFRLVGQFGLQVNGGGNEPLHALLPTSVGMVDVVEDEGQPEITFAFEAFEVFVDDGDD